MSTAPTERDAIDAIAHAPPRERSGSVSSNRFAFQDDWALCHLLELHLSGSDYRVVFDFHDDILVLDGSVAAQNIRFYQIKTNVNGNWTRKKLLKRKAGKNAPSMSPLGKLRWNYVTFPANTERMTFVSNARYDLLLQSGDSSLTKERICLTELDSSERTTIQAALKKELSLMAEPGGEDKTFLEVTSLSVQDHSSHATGKVAEFLRAFRREELSSVVLYQTLNGEIQRKSQYEFTPGDVEEVKAKVSICKGDFETMIGALTPANSVRTIVDRIRQRLTVEGLHFHEVELLCHACERFDVQRMGGESALVEEAVVVVDSAVRTVEDRGYPTLLNDSVEAVRGECGSTLDDLRLCEEDTFLRGMILMRLYEKRPLPAVGAKPKDETT